MRALREPDAFPLDASELARVLKLDDPSDLERRSSAWRPWRSYALMYLWVDSNVLHTPRNGSALRGRRDKIVNNQFALGR
jgi:3-methyladenine DNA glycosylase/8-oxoguanine DNA glycosylase